MSITTLTVFQNNKVGNVDLLAIQSPLVFAVDATYTGVVPEFLYVDLKDSAGVVLNTYKAAPYADIVDGSIRRFIFISDSVLRSYANDFEEFDSVLNAVEEVENITTNFTLVFRDPEEDASDLEIEFEAMQASRQFGETPAMVEQYNNDDELIIGIAEDFPFYSYFFNEDNTATSINMSLIV